MSLTDQAAPNNYSDAVAGSVPSGGSVSSGGSAVAWSAVAAGAAAAAALSLILLLLGTGLGLSSVSPWSTSGVAAATFGIGTILWITFTQIAASGMGGYLAGRLRTRWPSVHTDEVYFRDTAHGFLAWALATLVTAAVLTSAVGSIIGSGAQAGASVVGGMTGAAATAATAAAAGGTAAAMSDNAGKADAGDSSSGGVTGYFVDTLFRKPAGGDSAGTAASPSASPAASAATGTGTPDGGAMPSSGAGTAAAPAGGEAGATREVARIIANAVSTGNLPADDSRYVGQIVAQRTGISQADAEKRVADSYARLQAKLRDAQNTAKEAADKARKASATASLWLFVSLLAGAFVASLSATYGGRRRDA